MTNTTTVNVKASSIRRDLFWTMHTLEDGTLRWSGYDDRNWWENVSTTDGFRLKRSERSGRVWRLNVQPLTLDKPPTRATATLVEAK